MQYRILYFYKTWYYQVWVEHSTVQSQFTVATVSCVHCTCLIISCVVTKDWSYNRPAAGVWYFLNLILSSCRQLITITGLTMLLSVPRIPCLLQQRITFSSVFLPKSLACNFSTSAIQTAKVMIEDNVQCFDEFILLVVSGPENDPGGGGRGDGAAEAGQN